MAAPPPDQHPWESWSEEDKERMRRVIQHADLAKNYRSAGMMAKPGARDAASALAARGGLTPDEALTLSRFRQFEETTGGDPGWQGPLNINTGPREPEDTADEIAARGSRFLGADQGEKRRIVGEMNAKNARAKERFYDDLVMPPAPKKLSQAEILAHSVKAKRKG